MLNRKGQGLTEYGIILLLVVLLGSGVWFGGGLGGDVQGMYSTIGTKLKSIVDGDAVENYDTDKVVLDGNTKVTFTSLWTAGSNTDSEVGRVIWYRNSAGKKVYVMYHDKYLTGHDSNELQGVHWNHDTSVHHETDGGLSSYFKATDGNYYKITEYTDGRETTLTKYDGTPTGDPVRIK